MLQITIPSVEYYDEKNNEFITTKQQTLQLEHSLLSLSKWESKWNKPFLLDRVQRTREECVDYIRCMTITQNVEPRVYNNITTEIVTQVDAYIDAPMTATTFSGKEKRGGGRNTVTAEIIYYWMISLGIPFECQKWHLNKLLTLIRVCNIKNGPQKKMGRKDTLNRYRALNAARRNRLNSTG